MRFRAVIHKADGGTREVEFESIYDARSVLAKQVEEEHLKPGESLATLIVGKAVEPLPYITRVS